MAHGGQRKGAGRKAGAVTQRSRAIAEGALEDDGLTPLAYMLGVIRDPLCDPKRRDAMAQAAAPYIHAKLSSIEVGGKDDKAIRFVIERAD